MLPRSLGYLLLFFGVIMLSACTRFGFQGTRDGPPGPAPDLSLLDSLKDAAGDASRDHAADASRDHAADASRDQWGIDADSLAALDFPTPDSASRDTILVPPDAHHADARLLDQALGDTGVPHAAWVTVPQTSFTMGSSSTESCRGSGESQHDVNLTHAFEIQTTEVTEAQFLARLGYNPSFVGLGGRTCGPTCPVETLTWHEAAAYCNALSQDRFFTSCYTCSSSGPTVICGTAPAYQGDKIYACPGFRLPTEAEWEAAYRAGTKTAYYNGPNDSGMCGACGGLDAKADKIAWFCANSGRRPHPVGQKQPNSLGLLDMAGNVWEWCHDGYASDLGTATVSDPLGPLAALTRVVRGGSAGLVASWLRAAARKDQAPTDRKRDLGFRCVRTTSTP